jgi:hypothetical protein
MQKEYRIIGVTLRDGEGLTRQNICIKSIARGIRDDAYTLRFSPSTPIGRLKASIAF